MVTQLGEECPATVEEVTRATWPWVAKQRWCPSPATGEYEATGLSLTQLGEPTQDGAVACLLVVQLDQAGPILQIPMLAVPKGAAGMGASNADTDTPGTGAPRATDGKAGDDPSVVIGETVTHTLFDGVLEPGYWERWVEEANVVSTSRPALEEAAKKVKPLGVEQSNSSVFLRGGASPLVAKTFRVLHPGDHPEAQLPKTLTEAGFEGVPRLAAYWDIPVNGENACTAVVSEAIEGATDGFDYFVELAERNRDPQSAAASLGETVAQMHHHLKTELGTGSPLPLEKVKRRVLCSLPNIRLAAPHVDDAETLDALVHQIRELTKRLPVAEDTTWETTRVHGDLHLGQTLLSDDRWVVLDFEGEPLRPLKERVEPDTPLRDVAGMLRSFDYALQKGESADGEWLADARNAFLDGYSQGEPMSQADQVLLTALEFEKAIYEVAYEATFRPERLDVPLAALSDLVARTETLVKDKQGPLAH